MLIRVRDEQGEATTRGSEHGRLRLRAPSFAWFNGRFQRFLDCYEGLAIPRACSARLRDRCHLGVIAAPLVMIVPFLGRAYFPRTDPGQFVINVKMPSGTRIEVTNQYIARVEDDIRSVVEPQDLDMIVSNIGVYPDLSAIYTTNSSMDTAFVQVSLKEDHSSAAMSTCDRVRRQTSREMPELTTYFQAGGLVDAVINQGLPAPIDIQVSSQRHGRSLRHRGEDRQQDPSFPASAMSNSAGPRTIPVCSSTSTASRPA